MSLTNDNLNKIKEFLDLEKIIVIEKVDILCFSKSNIHTPEFNEKFNKIEKEIKSISKNIDIKIIQEGD